MAQAPTKIFAILAILVLLVSSHFAFSLVRVPAVLVVKPTRGPAVEAVYATGTVESTVMLPVAPRNSARLIELHVDEGSEVAKQQVLARLEDEDLRQTVNELHAKEENAAKEAKRMTNLYQAKTISKEEYDKAVYQYSAATAARKAAEVQAGYMTLRAPAEGRIIRRDGEIGELIAANQAIFWLSGPGPLRVSAEVDEEDIPQVKPGQKVLIQSDAFPGQVFIGEVQSITPKGDPVARSYRVRIRCKEDLPLLIGMTAESNIIIQETTNALLLPSSAVIGDRIWLVRDGTLHQQKVEIGARGIEHTEIRSGIDESAIVVLEASPDLQSGKSVRTKAKSKS